MADSPVTLWDEPAPATLTPRELRNVEQCCQSSAGMSGPLFANYVQLCIERMLSDAERTWLLGHR